MPSQASRSLGILQLERGLTFPAPPSVLPNSLLNPASFDFPIISETVEGAWVENVVRGDPELEPAFIEGARRLVARGARAITSTCGFSIRHQEAVARAVQVPVVLSSIILLPSLLRQIPAESKIAVLTFDSTHCTDELLGSYVLGQRNRIVVGGVEGGKFWHDELKRPSPPIDLAAIENDVTQCIDRLRSEHDELAAILFECTGFPMVAPAIRAHAGLPVYDITDLCRLTMASVA